MDGVQVYHKVTACDASDVCSPMTTPFTLSERAAISGWNYAFTYYNSGANINFQFINFMAYNLRLALHVTNGNLSNSPRLLSTNGKDPTPCIASNTVSGTISYPASLFTYLTVGTLGHTVQDPTQCGSNTNHTGDGLDNRWGYLINPTCLATPAPAWPNPCQPKPTPLVTPPTGNVSGVYDIRVGNLVNNASLYSCISRMDEARDSSVKSAAQCEVELGGSGIGDVNAEPPPGVALPPHNADNTAGAPPPPPYTDLAPTPSKGYGYVDASGTLVTYTCFANIGSTPYNANSLGPNLIAKVVILNFNTQITTNGKATGGGAGTQGTGLFIGSGFTKKSGAQCDAVANGDLTGLPDTSSTQGLPATFYPANSADPRCSGHCVLSQWRVAGSGLHGYPNWDGDNCSDSNELFAAKPGLGTKGCGDDPWSPLDSVTINSADDIAGMYGVEVTLARQDITSGTTIVPGHYITCSAYVQKGMTGGVNVEARLLCNHDSTSEAVNPNYGAGCGSGGHLCGDGSPGAAPPGCNNLPATCQAASPDTAHSGTCNFARGYPPYNEPPCFDLADLNTVQWLFPPVGKPGDTYPQPEAKQPALTGAISGNTLTLAGCFQDWDNTAVDGNSYWVVKANVHTGAGLVSITTGMTANCASGGSLQYSAMPIILTRQTADTCTTNNAVCQPLGGTPCTAGSTAACGYNTAKWDSDGDTCPDAWELSDVTNVPYRKAGLRDPGNRWDYMDVNHDGFLDIGDESDVVQKYFIDKGETTGGAGGPDNLPPGYLIETDRTGLAGSEDWELNSPDGYVTIDDVVDSANSYGHTCPPLDGLGNPIALPDPNAG